MADGIRKAPFTLMLAKKAMHPASSTRRKAHAENAMQDWRDLKFLNFETT